MKHTQLNITGMSCGHCVAGIQRAFSQIAGLESADVTVGQANVHFDESTCKTADLVKAVEAAGFGVAGFKTLSD
jgi:copper chaperone